jgi:hypothetical protein
MGVTTRALKAPHLISITSKIESRRTLTTLCVSVSSASLEHLTVSTGRACLAFVVQDGQVRSLRTRTLCVMSWVAWSKDNSILRTFWTLLAHFVRRQSLIFSTSFSLSVIEREDSVRVSIEWSLINRLHVIFRNDVGQFCDACCCYRSLPFDETLERIMRTSCKDCWRDDKSDDDQEIHDGDEPKATADVYSRWCWC